MTRLFRWLAPLLIVLGGWLAPATAQNPVPPNPPAAKAEPSALPYVVAVLYTIIILWIVCMPTRKGT
jgi:hypothetical protein